MDRIAELRNRQRATTKALTLAILMVIMDLSGFSGAFAGELDERQDKLETLSGVNMPGFQSGLVNSSQTFDIYEDGYTSCAVLDNSSLYCWGDGGAYSLGRGNSTSSSVPVPVARPEGWVEKTHPSR